MGCVLAAAAAWPDLQVHSADAQTADGGAAKVPVQRLVGGGRADFCAAYGAGFVRLQGTDTCVRIGGHVRVDTMSGSTRFEWRTGNFAAAPAEDDNAPSHVRLDSDFGPPGFR